jgi:hypothetical protein
MSAKVVRLKDAETGVTNILKDLLEHDLKDELNGIVIIASVGDTIHRWFFDKDRRSTNILGLIEYMKAYVIDYTREDGEL